MAGPEENLCATQGNKYFRNFEHWVNFNAYTGSRRKAASMDVAEQVRMREEQARVYSQRLVENRLGVIVDISRRDIAK